MADLEVAATEAVSTVNATLAAAEETLGRFGDVRQRLARADEIIESGWARLRERVQAFLAQAEEETRDLVAARGEASAALAELGAGLVELRDEAPRGMDESREEFEALGAAVEAIPVNVTGLTHAAEEADRRLESRLAAFQQEVEGALAANETLLRADLVGELKRVDAEVERVAIEVQAYVEGEVLPALAERSQGLFDLLVQAEEDLRLSLEGSSEETEATTDDVLRVCNETYNDTLEDLVQIASKLDDMLHGLGSFLEDKEDRFDDEGDRFHEGFKAAERALRDANDVLKAIEAELSRYSFVRL